ncbi:MAG TPA: caspase family protein, partial [Longimicrobiales bacterium]|nr:caspase family protein [Longimicrobiales bacterium]
MKRTLILLLMAAAATPLNGQTPRADGLEITLEEPADWLPAATTATRGITVAPRTSIRVSGTVKHANGVQDVLLDGNRASVAPQADGSVRFIGYVLVKERMQSAEIVVVTRTGERATRKYNISPTAPPPEAAPTPQDAWVSVNEGFQGKRWAVIIGISEYRDENIQGLQYADRDAKAMYDFLRSDLVGPGGFAPENVRVLLNQDATFENMRVALMEFLKPARPEDVVYIYFAGHGAADPDRPENYYLMPYDARANAMGATGFPMTDMNRAMNNVLANKKILITDACHSGAINSEGMRSLEMNEINERFLNQTILSEDVNVTFTASGPRQTSQEGDRWGGGHGVFTYYLLNGLKGAADVNRDHIVSIGEAMQYTVNQVARETANRQVPGISSTAYDFNFPVAMVVPGAEIPVTSFEEIQQNNLLGSVMTSAYESAWVPPDSLVTMVGDSDTVRIHLANERNDAIPTSLLSFSSSNTSVLSVDAAGVLTGHNAGTALVKVEGQRGLNRSVTMTVRVLPRPSQVTWSPLSERVQLVVGEPFQIRTDLLMGTDRWMRGMVPRVTPPDSLILRPEGDGRFMAEREGETRVTATIAGITKEYAVSVIPPLVKVKPLPVAVAVGDSIRLGAMRTRPDGVSIGDAGNVLWRSSDTTRAAVRDDVLFTKGIGRVTIHAEMGGSSDSVTVFVLGDLLVGVQGRLGETIVSVAVSTGEVVPLLPPELKAGQPALSPRGDRIAFVQDRRIHIMDSDGTNIRRVTPDMNGLLGVRTSRY